MVLGAVVPYVSTDNSERLALHVGQIFLSCVEKAVHMYGEKDNSGAPKKTTLAWVPLCTSTQSAISCPPSMSSDLPPLTAVSPNCVPPVTPMPKTGMPACSSALSVPPNSDNVVPATMTADGWSANAASAADWTVDEKNPALIAVSVAPRAAVGATSSLANMAQMGAPHSR